MPMADFVANMIMPIPTIDKAEAITTNNFVRTKVGGCPVSVFPGFESPCIEKYINGRDTIVPSISIVNKALGIKSGETGNIVARSNAYTKKYEIPQAKDTIYAHFMFFRMK